jgi:ankyrin repeat protein
LFHSRQTFFKATEKLLNKGIRFDLADSNDRTPFLIFYEKKNMLLADHMLDMGASINQMDKDGMFALKYALNLKVDRTRR